MRSFLPILCTLNLLLTVQLILPAQDTFSIVAVDPATGEVGSAGASCISKDNLAAFFPNFDPDFLGDLLPGVGAINTQSFYLQANQLNARTRLTAGDTPQQLMDWLAANDAEGNSTQRQYGAAALIAGQAQAAAFTGVNCLNHKGQRVGADYTIQGNILLGPQVLDSMEARFLQASGCLSDRLMAAMQGANIPGADSRCLGNGSSSLFAFIKVAKPNDDPVNPSLRLFVSLNPVGLEPIDSLQTLYNAVNPCITAAPEATGKLSFSITPNPSTGAVRLQWPDHASSMLLEIFSVTGQCIQPARQVVAGEVIRIKTKGIYLLKLQNKTGHAGIQKLVVH